MADVPRRCFTASEIAGVGGVVAHAMKPPSAFYKPHLFTRLPLGERVMLISIETVRSLVGKL